jgi:acyl-CoA synthetase (AMP-forming)/AMP-acid ligase II
VYPPSIDFSVAFLACLKAGVVAVPVFPPHPARRDTLHMFAKITESSGAKHALTNLEYNHLKKLAGAKDALANRFQKRPLGGKWPESLEWITTDNKTGSSSSSGSSKKKSSSNKNSSSSGLPPSPKSSDLAFLQYTSGSTSEPKGVMITHGNLAHNLTIITSELKAGKDTVVVSWLPQYHDMGLIGSYLGVLYCGGSGYYMSPLSFLQRPMLWMEAVSKHKGTHLQAPNFAFKLTARKFRASDYVNRPLDLSSVRHIINAAEPVDREGKEVFNQAFTPFGLPPNVIYPTYGLAEHTVFVCSGGKQTISVDKEQLEAKGVVSVVAETENSNSDSDSGGVTNLVGCGFPHKQKVDVRIVDRETCTEVPDERVGEIWVRSPSKAGGYFGKEDATREDFGATLAGDENNKTYLRTGDLGFFYKDELFICGRLKDLIIVAGRNYYPQDIEATAESTSPDQLRPGCSAAFTIDVVSHGGGGEEVALVMELRDVPSSAIKIRELCDSLADTIRAAITQEHSLGLSQIVFLQTKTVPKTSSGKIARAWCRKGFLAGTLKVVYKKSFATKSNGGNSNSNGISSFEIEGGSQANEGNSSTLTKEKIAELRAMDKTELTNKLRLDVARMGEIPPDSIDNDTALVTILDSLSISQFAGRLESAYAVKLSDEYLFREGVTLTKLAEVAKLGYAPDDVGNDGDAHGPSPSSSSPQGGNAEGLAGALGCPPGVKVCCIIQ